MLSEIFFGRCPSCHGHSSILQPLCDECKDKLKPLNSFCSICGFPLKSVGSSCPSCSSKAKFRYGRVFACYKYEGVMRDLLLSIKFKYNLRSALTFNKILYLPEEIKKFSYDVIVPVPSHFFRKFRRFCHPAVSVSLFLSSALNIPLKRLIYRNRRTHFQYELKPDERKKNVKGAFSIKGSVPANILLVDDIFTTGSTLNECASLLKSAGALHTDCFVSAVD